MAGELIVKNGLRVSGSTIISGSITATSFTGSFSGSLASSSFASTASFAPLYTLVSATSSMLASYLLVANTSSFVVNSQTGSFVQNSQTGSFVINSQTGSFVQNSFTASMLAPYLLVSNTSSFATTTQLNSYLLISNTASMIAPYLLISNTGSMLTPYTPNSQTGSLVQNSFTASMLAPYLLISNTGSMVAPYLLTSRTSSFATTGSNSFTGSQTITGTGTTSATTAFTVRNANTSASLSVRDDGYVGIGTTTPNSQLEVVTGANAIRFGGSNGRILAAYVSGALANFDFYAVQTYFNSDFLIEGGKKISTANGSTANLYLTTNDATKSIYIDRSVGIQVPTASVALDVSGSGKFTGNLTITGSIVATSVTGSFLGTASYAANSELIDGLHSNAFVTNNVTGSMLAPYLLVANTSSFVSSSQLTPYLLVSNTSSFVVNSQTGSFVLNSFTSSMLAPYLLVANTSSFATTTQLNSYLLISNTGSMLTPYLLTSRTSSFATTGSNIFIGTQTITGSLNVSGSINLIQRASFNGTNTGGTVSAAFTPVDNLGNTTLYSDTNLYFKSNAYTFFDSGFNTTMLLTNAGNLAIGPSAPLARLHIKGSGTTSGTIALLVHNANSSASLTVLDNGNVGIGTVSPSQQIHAVASGDIYSLIESTGTGTAGNLYKNSLRQYFTGTNYATANSWEVYDLTAAASRIWISGPDGNIGINKTSATYKLDVGGDLRSVSGAYFATAGGFVGIGTTTAAALLDVNGSGRFAGGLTITGSLNISGSVSSSFGFTGSFLGTASYASNADNLDGLNSTAFVTNNVTGSMLAPYLLVANTSSFATTTQLNSYLLISNTSSMLVPYLLVTNTGSMIAPYLLISNTSSMLTPYLPTGLTSSFAKTNASNTFVGTQVITGSLSVTGSGISGSFSGSFLGDGSGLSGVAASFPINPGVVSATTQYFVNNGGSSQYITHTQVANALAGGGLTSNGTSLTVNSSSFSGSFLLISSTGSMLAPYLLVANTSSFATTSQLASYLLISNTGSMLAPYLLVANTGSMLSPYLITSRTSSFATTGSNTFIGTQTITGSLNLSGSISSSFGFTGSFLGTASYAGNAELIDGLHSNAFVTNNITGSMLAPYLLVANTSSFATTSQLASYLLLSNTSSMLSPYLLVSNTSSFATTTQLNSYLLISNTASMVAPYMLISNTGSMLSPYTPNSQTGSFIRNNQTSSFYTGSFTGSFIGTSSFAATASRVNTLNQNVLITGSLTVGSTSLGSNENTIAVGPPPAGGSGEGGQILLAAAGGTYTSASMLDTYQDSFRVLRGTNAGSDAFKLKIDLNSGQVQIPNYNSPTAFTGAPVNSLATDNSGNLLTVQGYSGIVTINTIPPVNFDIQNGIIVNVF